MADTYPATLTYLHDATTKEFALDMETIEDSFSKSIARYEYPFRDGADLQDLGRKARTSHVRCYFYNDTYDEHKVFLNYLETVDGSLWHLTHPNYGVMEGKIESVNVRHDDRERTAEIDLMFIEQMRGKIDPYPATSVGDDTESAFEEGIDELDSEIETDMEDALGAETSSVLDVVLDTTADILSQFNGLSMKARSYVKAVAAYIAVLNNTLTTVTNLTNSIVATISYATNLPGVLVSAIASAAERYAILYDSLTSSPTRYMTSLVSSLTALEDSSGTCTKYMTVHIAQRCALDLATMFQADKEKSLALKQSRETKSFSPEGRLVASPATLEQPLTMNEIEEALSYARTQLQAAVDLARNMDTLKAMAQTLTDNVSEVKKTRPKVIAVDVDNETPLHLLCLRYGLTYSDAEALMGMNSIRNPNFVKGEVNIYAG